MKNSWICILIVLGLFSCGSENAKEKSDEKVSKEEKVEESTHDATEETLRLDDGKKWIVNSETTAGVDKMIQRTDTFRIEANSEEYQILFDSLDSDFRYIFKMCTTEGTAHDQLHLMLFPLRGMFNRLKSPEEKIRKEAIREIKKQLGLYHTHFSS